MSIEFLRLRGNSSSGDDPKESLALVYDADEDNPFVDAESSSAPSDEARMSLAEKQCCGWFVSMSTICRVVVVVSILLVVAICLVAMLVPDACIHFDGPAVPLPDPTYLGVLTDADKQRKHFVVQLHGDSLMKNPEDMHYPFHSLIQDHLSSYSFSIERYADYAKKVSDVVVMIEDAQSFDHDGIIFLGDTDVTNVNWGEVNATSQETRRTKYAADLRYIVESALETKKHIALCSPGMVLTEGWRWFYPVFPKHAMTARFTPETHAKQRQYSAIVEAVAGQFGVPFIDLRAPFLANVYPWRLVYKGCVTRDGEHANAHGTTIMAKLFAEVSVLCVVALPL